MTIVNGQSAKSADVRMDFPPFGVPPVIGHARMSAIFVLIIHIEGVMNYLGSRIIWPIVFDVARIPKATIIFIMSSELIIFPKFAELA